MRFVGVVGVRVGRGRCMASILKNLMGFQKPA